MRLFILLAILLLSCESKEYKNIQNLHYWHGSEALYTFKTELPVSEDYIVVVEKSKHKLSLYKNGNLIKRYNTNIRNELPDHLTENDGQSPEGVFPVYQMAVVTDPPWSRWIAFNTIEKAKTIYISENTKGKQILDDYEAQYGEIQTDADIRNFNAVQSLPNLTRGFGIHGGGFYYNNGSYHDWTLGCPALNDADVNELYDLLLTNPNGGIGTLIYIID